MNFRQLRFSETHGYWRHEKGPKLLRPGPMDSLYALGSLAVPLRRLFDRWSRPLQVLRCHHRMDLYGRVQSEEKRFRYSGDLGGVVHVNNEVSTPCAFHVCEVRCLEFDLLKDRLNSLAHVTAPGQSFPFSFG